MNQRFRCPSCNGKDTVAEYFCPKCDYNWEEDAELDEMGNVHSAPCPRCLKMTPPEAIRCTNINCMAVYPPPEPL
ncbi:MAG: hypothetical protein ACUVUD_02970 [bacterium]